ncbi:MAG: hypothetical protein J0G33_15775 [Afipia felis]|nr:hypothetical protein [Afipia felis]
MLSFAPGAQNRGRWRMGQRQSLKKDVRHSARLTFDFLPRLPAAGSSATGLSDPARFEISPEPRCPLARDGVRQRHGPKALFVVGKGEKT